MLPRNINSWIVPFTLGSMAVVALVFVALVLQHRIGMAIVRHVERRQRALLPFVLRAIGDVDAVSALRQNLRLFDLRIVRDLLMQLAMDLRVEDAPDVACLCDQLGLLEPEIKSLFALRSRTRRRAAANLGLLRPLAAVEPLLDLLDDRHINVRLAAIDALADIGDDLGLVALIPMLEDPEPAIAGRALEALCRSGRDVGVHVLRYLELTQDPNAIRMGIESMRWLQPQAAEDRLCAIAKGPRWTLRAQTPRVLAEIGSARCEAALRDLLSDPNPKVRARATQALGSLGRKETVPALRAAFEDDAWPVRMEAARALVGMEEPGITAFLEELSEHGREAGSAVGSTGAGEAAPAVSRTVARARVA